MPKSNDFAEDVLWMALAGVDPYYRTNPYRYLSLHTASPGADGKQDTNEISYSGYERKSISTDWWNDDGTSFSSPTVIDFAQNNTGSPIVITHIAIGIEGSGSGRVLYYSQLAEPVTVKNGHKPSIPAGSLLVNEA